MRNNQIPRNYVWKVWQSAEEHSRGISHFILSILRSIKPVFTDQQPVYVPVKVRNGADPENLKKLLNRRN